MPGMCLTSKCGVSDHNKHINKELHFDRSARQFNEINAVSRFRSATKWIYKSGEHLLFASETIN